MPTQTSGESRTIAALAAEHGIRIPAETLRINEAGLDYRVAFGTDADGVEWVLRMPRRADVADKIPDEAAILAVAGPGISAAVPDWRVHSSRLIAYPLLPGEPGLTLDDDGSPVWHVDPDSPVYARSLGRLIAELHAIDATEAGAAGIDVQTPAQARAEWKANLALVTDEFSVDDQLLARWEAWLAEDSFWPDFSVFTHGELYPAHVLLDADAQILSVLDWTTAKVGDPALDFMFLPMMSTPPDLRSGGPDLCRGRRPGPAATGRSLCRTRCCQPPRLRDLCPDHGRP